MNTLLIAYDLNRPAQKYTELIKAIKDLGPWWHHLDSTWLVSTSLSPSQARQRLWAVMDSNDELLVINVVGDTWAADGFEDSAYAWLKKYVAA